MSLTAVRREYAVVLRNAARPGSTLPAASGACVVRAVSTGGEQITVCKAKDGTLYGRTARLPRGVLRVGKAGWLQPEAMQAAMVAVRQAMGREEEAGGAGGSTAGAAR